MTEQSTFLNFLLRSGWFDFGGVGKEINHQGLGLHKVEMYYMLEPTILNTIAPD